MADESEGKDPDKKENIEKDVKEGNDPSTNSKQDQQQDKFSTLHDRDNIKAKEEQGVKSTPPSPPTTGKPNP